MNLYVHLPFCDHICFYCDFKRKVSISKKEYIDALYKEFTSLNVDSIDTLYFGGGTPSSLSIDELKQIGNWFIPYLSKDYEWTIECNPDSLTKDKIILFKEMGVNRISLGVQSFQDELLQKIGRHHSSFDVYRCINDLRECDLKNISIDLIYALPNQTLKQVQNDVNIFLSLQLPHCSIYSLQIEENSVFGKQHLKPADQDLEADMYDCICQTLKGYHHYEISSFCLNGYESKHNLVYWSDKDFTGIGWGSSGKEKGIRYDHASNYNDYLLDPLKRYFIETTKEDLMFEAIMMSLRTTFGLNVKQFNEKYKIDFYECYKKTIQKYQNYFIQSKDSLVCTQEGRNILNTILIDFLE